MGLIRHRLLVAVLATLPLALAAPAVSQSVEQQVDAAVQALRTVEDETDLAEAVTAIRALGEAALPALVQRLAAAADDEERVDVTYAIGLLLPSGIGPRRGPAPPPELGRLVSDLLREPRDMMLEGNLANIAASLGPHTSDAVPGLLALLARSEDQGLRATTSAALAFSAPDGLPAVHDAMRASADERFLGDLALVLRGSEIPDDVAAILDRLLESDRPEARRNAARTLEEAGAADDRLLRAALADLESASTDTELSLAASRVAEHSDGSARTAEALATALDRAGRVEERQEIARALATTSEPGLRLLATAAGQASSPEARVDLIRALGTFFREHPGLPEILVATIMDADDEDVRMAAGIALVGIGEAALPAIEARRGADPFSEAPGWSHLNFVRGEIVRKARG